MDQFHPAVSRWFRESFESPTQPQTEAWHALSSGNHALVAAPTGSGKTLAAFLVAIDGLVKQAVQGLLKEEVTVVYVSPLKALSNDIHQNLEQPLEAIQENLESDAALSGQNPAPIRSAVRTGDTPQRERTKMIRTPPNILVTTPESLYILLTSDSGRKILGTARTLIIDEIHTMVSSKRGAHLALSMERLQRLCGEPLTRIGLSATQKPIETVVQFLTGTGNKNHCNVIDSGHLRDCDLQICLPDSALEAVMPGEVWSELYRKLEERIVSHRTTLIFVNTRRLAERMSKALGERLGEDAVTSHHGSLAREHRLCAEHRLKTGGLKALVATASLELGIDIGEIDLVCQIGSPRSVNVFLQRVGRSGHSLGETPKGVLFPLSRDDLVECVALLGAVREGDLDLLSIYPLPLDVLAQQIIAEVSAGKMKLDDLFQMVRKASPYAGLERGRFDEVVNMVAEGFNTRRGRRSAYLHLDAVNGLVGPRKGARLTAITNGGTIPDQFDYDVVLQPDGLKIGTLNEDFSFESLPGDIFQLGNTSYQILKVETGKVFVVDARGQPPNIPFWFGEAPGRTDVVSHAVSRLRKFVGTALSDGRESARGKVQEYYRISDNAANQLVNYLAAAQAALGALPTTDTIIFERFFDEAGDQHLVIHSTFGSRANRAWGLALRKRFCRKFNFELQAAALEDAIVLSLGSTHSFPLSDPAGYLKKDSVEEILTQALLDAPMFPTHWRWNASIALAIRRFSNGTRTPPQFQRSNAEDLMALVFPDQIACAENLAGYREIPDHPLVAQTLYDCLNRLMDVNRLKNILENLHDGNIALVCRELAAPSLLAEEILVAKPYAFLDDTPAEERRTSLVRTRQFLHPEDAVALGVLDQQVIRSVRQEAWPDAGNPDECHDALLILGGITAREAAVHGWLDWLGRLARDNRACELTIKDAVFWVASERLHLWRGVHTDLSMPAAPGDVPVPDSGDPGDGLTELIRMRLQGTGPITGKQLARFFGVAEKTVRASLLLLEQEGYVMSGNFEADSGSDRNEMQWCERGILARIHRRTVRNLRRHIQPASITGFMRFLFRWQGLDGDSDSAQGNPETLAGVLKQLEGVEVAAGAWEESVLPARLNDYQPYWLDMLCASGRASWLRLSQSANPVSVSPKLNKQSPIALLSRITRDHWLDSGRTPQGNHLLSHRGRKVHTLLAVHGPQFFDDLVRHGEMAFDVEQGLAELAGLGMVSSDNFAGLRALIQSSSQSGWTARNRKRVSKTVMLDAGRWAPTKFQETQNDEPQWDSIEYIAGVLLGRYGVVFRRLLDLEPGLPNWRELQYVYRRMEARGDVRGGRFVNGFSGEQFALPEAVGLLRHMEKKDGEPALVSISAADPLNLTGMVLPGDRVPKTRKNRLLFQHGELVATLISGEIKWLKAVEQKQKWQAQQKLTGFAAVKSIRHRHRRFPPVH